MSEANNNMYADITVRTAVGASVKSTFLTIHDLTEMVRDVTRGCRRYTHLFDVEAELTEIEGMARLDAKRQDILKSLKKK